MNSVNGITVGELIEVLNKHNRDNVVCLTDLEDDDKIYRSVSIVIPIDNVEYIGDDGIIDNGNILLLY